MLEKILQKQNALKVFVVCIALLFLVVKIPGFRLPYLERDEPLYAWQSLVIYKDPAMVFSPELNYPYYPLFPALAAPLHAFFPPPIPIRIVSLAFALIGLLFTYLIAKKMFSEKAGLAAVVLMILSPAFFFYSTRGMSDIPLMALSAIVIYLLITLNKRRVILLAATLATMYLIKTASMVVLPAVVIFLLIKYREKFNKKHVIFGAFALIALIAASFALSPFKMYFVFGRVFTSPYYLPILKVVMRSFFWDLIGVPLALLALIGILFMRKRFEANIALLILWIVSVSTPFLLISINWIRYHLPIMPVIAAIAGYGFVTLAEKGKRKTIIAIVIASLLTILLYGGLGATLYLADHVRYFEEERWDEMSQWFAENVGEEDRLIILSEKYVKRGILFSAELGLKNARQQMIDNPGKEEFERIINEPGRNYFVAADNVSHMRGIVSPIWLYKQDVNAEKYLASRGFEKVKEFPRQEDFTLLPGESAAVKSHFMEDYLVYRKPKQ